MLEKKGQSSFEITMIVIVVISVSAIVISNYVRIGDTTMALAIAKQSITEKLLQQPSAYTIKTLESLRCDANIHFGVTTIPNDLNRIGFNNGTNLKLVESDITRNTGFTGADINFNEGITPCP